VLVNAAGTLSGLDKEADGLSMGLDNAKQAITWSTPDGTLALNAPAAVSDVETQNRSFRELRNGQPVEPRRLSPEMLAPERR
jgi:hypothetical protein